jgi:hypothetical protein
MDPTFKAAFSPAKYGWDDALKLNCLQYMIQKKAVSIFNCRHFYRQPTREATYTLFTEATGSEMEADFITLNFLYEPTAISARLILLSTEEEIVNTLLHVFVPEPDLSAYDTITQAVYDEVTLLRRRLHRTPRAIAFLEGRHTRLGGGSAVRMLGEDVCRAILGMV